MVNPSDLVAIERMLEIIRSIELIFNYTKEPLTKSNTSLLMVFDYRRHYLYYLEFPIMRIGECTNKLMSLTLQQENLQALRVGLQAIEEVIKLLDDSISSDGEMLTRYLRLRTSYMNQIAFESEFMFNLIINNTKEE